MTWSLLRLRVGGQHIDLEYAVHYSLTPSIRRNSVADNSLAASHDLRTAGAPTPYQPRGLPDRIQEAPQQGTTELALWIKRDYKLSWNESNVALGTAMEYDIAEVVGPQFHVVGKISKSVLATLATKCGQDRDR